MERDIENERDGERASERKDDELLCTSGSVWAD